MVKITDNTIESSTDPAWGGFGEVSWTFWGWGVDSWGEGVIDAVEKRWYDTLEYSTEKCK